QADRGGVAGGDLEARRVAADDADGGAVQVVADDPHLARDDRRVERLAATHAAVDEAGVVGDASAAHEVPPGRWTFRVGGRRPVCRFRPTSFDVSVKARRPGGGLVELLVVLVLLIGLPLAEVSW